MYVLTSCSSQHRSNNVLDGVTRGLWKALVLCHSNQNLHKLTSRKKRLRGIKTKLKKGNLSSLHA